jgi:hypothetical protein
MQWLDQFARDGDGLEVSYYWTFVTPTYLVATAVLAGCVAWTMRSSAVLISLWFAVLALTASIDVHIPAGWIFGLCAVAIVGALASIPRIATSIVVGTAVLVLLVTQVAAPRYDPSAYHNYNIDPLYDSVFYNDNSPAVTELHELLWFEDAMDQIDDDGLYFIGVGPGAAIIGIYGAHVTGRWLRHDENGNLDDDTLHKLKTGQIPRVAIYGPPQFADSLASQFIEASPGSKQIYSATNPGDLGYRVNVVDIVDPSSGPLTWAAADLPSKTGDIEGASRVADPSRDRPDYLMYGPYARLAPGRYRVAMTYRSPAAPTVEVGTFDIAHDGGVAVAQTQLTGTAGAARTIELLVDVASPDGWEFRAFWNGAEPIEVLSVRSQPVDVDP